ncbi:Peptidyl-prolyl cis-trans isomerase CYP21-4, partial [Linum perenne]
KFEIEPSFDQLKQDQETLRFRFFSLLQRIGIFHVLVFPISSSDLELVVNSVCEVSVAWIRNGADQTSSSAATEQEEESAESDKRHYYYCLQLDRCSGSVLPLLHLQAPLHQVSSISFFPTSVLPFRLNSSALIDCGFCFRSNIQDSNTEDGRKLTEVTNSDIPGYVILTTSKGPVTVELFKDSSPEIVDKFVHLCQKGRFKGMQFHRVIKHYIIQAGNTDNLGNTEDWTVKGKHNAQLDASLKHEAFMVGTSKEKHDNKGFDLFITTAPIPDLSDKLVVFGRVVKGEDVVQEIEDVDTDEHHQPKSQMGITDIALRQKV